MLKRINHTFYHCTIELILKYPNPQLKLIPCQVEIGFIGLFVDRTCVIVVVGG